MDWALAAFALLLMAYVCRRILRMDESSRPPWRPAALPLNRFQIYRNAAQEIETQSYMLGVTVNEALGDFEAGDGLKAAAEIVLAAEQWDLLAQLVSNLLKVITESMPQVGTIASYREINPAGFRSRAMAEFMKSGGKLHQFIYRSKGRFDFRLQLIRSAVAELTAEFRSSYASSGREQDFPPTQLKEIDPTLHDYDLVAKEALLAMRDFLGVLPEGAVPAFGMEVAQVVSLYSVRSRPSSSREVNF